MEGLERGRRERTKQFCKLAKVILEGWYLTRQRKAHKPVLFEESWTQAPTLLNESRISDSDQARGMDSDSDSRGLVWLADVVCSAWSHYPNNTSMRSRFEYQTLEMGRVSRILRGHRFERRYRIYFSSEALSWRSFNPLDPECQWVL